MPADTDAPAPAAPRTVGIVGGGQLARMMCEAASALGVRTVVLAARPDDAATSTASEVVVGEATDKAALRVLAAKTDVVTFDHEQVDLDVLARLDLEGVLLRPGVETLRIAVDKAEMRARLAAAGVPVPRFEVLEAAGAPGRDARALARAIAAFAGTGSGRWPVVVKATRGGYDGKGVWPVGDERAARSLCESAVRSATPLLVEEHVDIDTELAVVVARDALGESVAWPPVETAQIEGVCREVRYPGRLPAGLAADAASLAREVAAVVGATGVLAVELFAAGGRLLVNEIAARPHNSAHWTIEGSTTSQFENHVRAVLGLPLGDASPSAPQVASVNVFGSPSAGALRPGNGPGPLDAGSPRDGLAAALEVKGAHVHLYGKSPRPGRKLGHVTVCGEDAGDVRSRAWAAARALGTPVPASIPLGTPVPASIPLDAPVPASIPLDAP